MATIEARGYINKPEVKMSAAGKPRVTFTLAVKQKEKAFGDRPEKVTKAFFNCTQFGASEAPADGSYGTVKGYLNVREYETNGQKRQALDVTVQEIEMAPPLAGNGGAPAKATSKPASLEKPAKAPAGQPWDDDMPF